MAARQIAESAVYTSVPHVAPLPSQFAGHTTCTASPISRLICVALNEHPASMGPPLATASAGGGADDATPGNDAILTVHPVIAPSASIATIGITRIT